MDLEYSIEGVYMHEESWFTVHPWLVLHSVATSQAAVESTVDCYADAIVDAATHTALSANSPTSFLYIQTNS